MADTFYIPLFMLCWATNFVVRACLAPAHRPKSVTSFAQTRARCSNKPPASTHRKPRLAETQPPPLPEAKSGAGRGRVKGKRGLDV
jgi:hypothetical protein